MLSVYTRRSFVRVAAGTALSTSVIGALQPFVVTTEAAPSRVRRSVGGMSASDPILVSYERAIRQMKNLPAEDPRNWANQVAIHGTYSTGNSNSTWNSCQHGPSVDGRMYFWPWHRMYIYWFERIVAKMADDPCWTLPYWDVSANHGTLPSPFGNPSSELCAPRDEGWNTGKLAFKPEQVDYSRALTWPQFTFGSVSIEGCPHWTVHGLLSDWMRDVKTAAQDPIFFLHHSNIDRLWDIWLAQTKGAADPLDDPIWLNKEFEFFDENGYRVAMKVCDVLRAQEQLGYSYEGEPPQSDQSVKVSPGALARSVTFTEQTLPDIPSFPREFTSTLLFSVPLDGIPDWDSLLRDGNRQVFLTLSGVNNQSRPAAVWDVYLGPSDTDFSGLQSPFFIGTLSTVQKDATFKYSVSSALSETIQRNQRKKRKHQVFVNLIASGPLKNGEPTKPLVNSPTKIERAFLSIETMATAP